MDLRDHSNLILLIIGLLYVLAPTGMIIQGWYVWAGLVMVALALTPITLDLILYDEASGASAVTTLLILGPALVVLGAGVVVRLFLISRAAWAGGSTKDDV